MRRKITRRHKVFQPVLDSSLDDGSRLLVIHASDVLWEKTLHR
jgi:hypothetical protein